MYMDRNQKNSKAGKIEYLELKYDTDVQSGLNLTEVRRRQRMQGIRNLTKEKKQIWLQCFQQEWQDLLFFFFTYLCVAGRIFSFPGRLRILFFSGFLFLSVLKIQRVVRYRKVLFRQKEIYEQKVTVLREGIFKRIREDGLVRGDIIRLKRGQEVPADSISLENPYISYQQGETFAENTGRAIVTKERSGQSDSTEKEKKAKRSGILLEENIQNLNTQNTDVQKQIQNLNTQNTEVHKPHIHNKNKQNSNTQRQNLMIQELFIRQGIYFPQKLKGRGTECAIPVREERKIAVICFEEMYFPSKFQVKKFRIFLQKLKETGVEIFFFTSQNKESAYLIGKQTGIVKEQREVLDHQQFLLLQNTALEKQLKSIKIYCRLSEEEKEQVIMKWERQLEISVGAENDFAGQGTGQLLIMSNLSRLAEKQVEGRKKPFFKENCIYACSSMGNKESDIYFKKYWWDGLLQYLVGKRSCQQFFLTMQKTETLLLGGFCVFMLVSFLLSFFFPQQGTMQWSMQTGSLLCALYIIGKEMVKEVFRCWFLQKIKRKK